MPHELSIERHIAAPPAEVWRIMTERIAEWWCPKPYTTTVKELEWRDGGAFHLAVRGPDGEAGCEDEDSRGGVLLDYRAESRFVFTDAFAPGWIPQEPFMVGIFEINPEGGGTLYRATARHWSAEAMEEHRKMGFEQGWSAVADQLAQLAEQP